MIRIPIGNSKSARLEVRSVAPDANPYLVLYSIFKTGIEGSKSDLEGLRQAERYLPDNIQKAIHDFRTSQWISEILGDDVKNRLADLKQVAADRAPRQLGTFVKAAEVQYHHEVYNQALWNLF
jgi:glutamine synthetase